MLKISDLHADIDGVSILKGVNLTIHPGEVHAVMGPNGSGKSTLSKVVAGHSDYQITQGDITLNGESLLELDPSDRALRGIFMAFQYPVEVPGVNNGSFLRMAYNAQRKFRGQTEVDPLEFEEVVNKKLDWVGMSQQLLDRPLNQGFSGGEKKRNEILQLAVLEPCLAILDETDSGLDIDALKTVSSAVNRLRSKERSFLVITHYQRLLDHIVPDVVHIFADGKIVRTGDASLAKAVEANGYDGITTKETQPS